MTNTADNSNGKNLEAVGKSAVRTIAENDPSYCPYCLRCTGLVRMRLVVPMLWKCVCGAVHDER